MRAVEAGPPLRRRPRGDGLAARVLLVQPSIAPPGGGNLVAAWILQALRDDHEVTLLALERPDLAACNRFFGTTLRPEDFTLVVPSSAARTLMRHTPTPLALLKHSYLMRRGAAIAARYDVVVTANNEADLGRRGLQYIYYPKLDLVRPAVDVRWYHASRPLLALYYRVCKRVAHFSAERMKSNVTLVVSDWIGRRVRDLHGIEGLTLYPAVPGDFPAVPWAEREDGFVCIGRISPEKRIETIVDVLGRVRARGRDVRLHVVGTDDKRDYARMVARLARDNAAWMTVHRGIARADLIRLVSRQRYGIHAMPDEHFGIAVAEMVRGGAIVFVPDDGGPAEIVGAEERLRWTTPAEAAEKILATLADPGRQAALRAHLAKRAELFGTEHFVTRIRDLVRAL